MNNTNPAAQNSNAKKIHCPKCAFEFQLDEVLSSQIESELRTSLEVEYNQKKSVVEEQLKAAETLKLQLIQKEKSIEDQVQQKLESEKKQLWAIAQQKAEEKMQEVSGSKIKFLEEELAQKAKKQQESEQKELDFARKMRELEAQKNSIQFELEKKFFEQAKQLEEDTRKKFAAEADMKFKEKEMQVEQMRKTIEELRRKSEQGSMQVQGDALENDLKDALSSQFPVDQIEDVPTGIKGADIIQKVRSEYGQETGVIIWESKNTKEWKDEWIRKLKEDQANVKADIAILVTKTMPKGVKEAICIEGVWVVDFAFALTIAAVLRSNLINIFKLKQSLVGTDEKMEMLHKYLTGNQFRNRIENIVLAFTSMQSDLDREKRLFQKQWAKREKEIERVVSNTTGLYGDLHGLMGQSMLSVPSLELEAEFNEFEANELDATD
jgi:hypothetical protein